MRVEDLMRTDVVTTPLSATLQDATGRLLDGEIGSVIAVDPDGSPVGILTDADLIRAGYRSQRPLTDIDVDDGATGRS